VWFEYGKTAADSSNYEYALACYANGIKLDPEVMSAHEAMYEVGIKYMSKAGRPATGKEIKSIAGDDSNPVAKLAAAEFEWMKDIANPKLALKAIEAAVKANQLQFGNWAAKPALAFIRRSKKVSKSILLQAKDVFKQVHAWDEAMLAGQLAMQLDPTDSELDHELKDISAQRAMDQGGYERAAGKEGGYRTFIKDAEKQRQLVESEAITASLSMEERNLQRAKVEYEKNPKVPDVVNQYAQLVKKQGTPEAEQLAYEIYMKGYQDTGEYRFRMNAGDIRVEQLRRAYEAAQAKAEESPENVSLKEQAQAAHKQLLALEVAEANERVAKYPTDRVLKMRLGEVQYALGHYEDAMAALQAAKDEPKLRVRAGHMLGKCFEAEGWHMEAVSEFKEALAAVDATEKDRELSIRYDLMEALIEYARQERSQEHAREALEICSGIARKDIRYRNISAKRKEVDQLLRELAAKS
jgi:predicted negative regulator of RcsB-dependent stress response